jgi:hypothetical protein
MGKKNICPLLKKSCIEHECAWFSTVQGKDPNTGRDLSEHYCVVNVLPFLLMENANQTRMTGATIDSMRNEAVSKSDTSNKLLYLLAQQAGALPPAS